MRVNLQDITFLLLVRLDTIERLENVLVVTKQLSKYFDTNILVVETNKYCNNILKQLLNHKIEYLFIEDKDPILHKTFYFNKMATTVKTPYIAIWDADIIPDKIAIQESINNLRANQTDVAYPYDGVCYDVHKILRDYFFNKKDIRFLYRNKNKMEVLHNRALVGGAVFVRLDKYKYCGMENEKHYGWGNDDFDRYYRFVTLGMKIYRTENPLFHLSHPRLENSGYHSIMHRQRTAYELAKTESSSAEELLSKIKTDNNK